MNNMNIDERLEALITNMEIMSVIVKDVVERIDKLAAVSERHEKHWERTAAIVRAALKAGFNENGEEQEGQ